MNSDNPESVEQQLLRRLGGRSAGLTTRELARSLDVRPSEANQVLLGLQAKGLVSLRGTKWFSQFSQASQASNVSAPKARQDNARNRGSSPGGRENRAEPDNIPADGRNVKSVDRRQSRWATFRRLCDYYAECVRLDQRSSISAKASEELESIVCLDGALPNSDRIRVRTRESWHKWLRKLAEDDYLFVGYPIQRYRWHDSESAEDIDFISPVFVQPFRVKIDGTELNLEAIGSIRINEGWLERRLKNMDERRVFLELCGADSMSDDGVNETTWGECAQLLNHFYPDWCVDRLDTASSCSTPPLEKLNKDGIYNRATLIIPKKFRYTGGLYKELLSLANEIPDEQLDQTSLVHLFPNSPARSPEKGSNERATASNAGVIGAQVLTLNHEQMQAIKAATASQLSIIVGPPGTGKSRVVAAALAQQALLDKSALLASKNHQALEAVVPRINAVSEPWPIMIRLARPWGAPADMSLHLAISQLVSSNVDGDRDYLDSVRNALARRISAHAQASEDVAKAGELRELMRKQLFELNELVLEVPEEYRNASLRGYAELPKCQDLQDTIELLVAIPRFRWSFKWLWQVLQARKRMAKGIEAATRIDAAMRAVFDTEGKLPSAGSGKTSDLAAYYGKVLDFWRPMSAVNESAVRLSDLRRTIEALPPTDEVCRKEHDAAIEVERLSVECFQELAKQTGAKITEEERSALANILASIENRSALDSEADHRRWSDAMRKAFPIFLKHFPLVATTNLSVKRDIDLQPAWFDLLIVDEASQCDVASVIPLLFRAKRALIVGDPMQLSHVTSLSSATDRHLRRQFGVDQLELERFSYRTSSMFHLANTSASVETRVSLRQHHRCHPSIAAYCSETFYKGSWTVLTHDTGKSGIEWNDIVDDSVSAQGGGAISPNQIQAICNEANRLLKSGFTGTLGIVTPFRQQANRIRDVLYEALPSDFIASSRLLVDTADGFQGDERDVVLFSLVAGDSLPEGSLNFLANGPNRFNVAVSRAKLQLHIFGDLNWARNTRIRHIKALADFYVQERETRNRVTRAGFREDLVGPVWEPMFANAMRKAGLEFHQQYPACGRFLDFALFKNNIKLDVEVDGETYHRSGSGDRVADDIRRDQALIANGWRILRFWVYELRENLDGCVAKVSKTLEKL